MIESKLMYSSGELIEELYVSLDELRSSFQILEEDCLGRHIILLYADNRCCRLDETIGVQVGYLLETGTRLRLIKNLFHT